MNKGSSNRLVFNGFGPFAGQVNSRPQSSQTFSAVTTDVDTALGCDAITNEIRSTTSSPAPATLGDKKPSISPKDRRSRPIDPDQDRFIRKKASWLCRLWPFNSRDLDDVIQELCCSWLAARDRFNPTRGSEHAYFKTIIERAAGKVRLRRKRELRVAPTLGSWDVCAEHLGPLTSAEVIRDRRQLMICPSLTRQEVVEIETDVSGVCNQLPEPQISLCDKLQQHTLAEISRETGTPESTLSSRVGVIRKRFEKQGLRDFL